MHPSSPLLANLVEKNKCIFKNQTPRTGKTLSKTWGLTSEILNVKGTTSIDHNTLQQEE